METESFRYTSRTDYENEIKKVIEMKKMKPKATELEEEYEGLVEEYLQFCTNGDGK